MKADFFRIWLAPLATAMLLAGPVLANATDIEAELAKQGDYRANFREVTRLAKENDPVAQSILGRIYLEGNGSGPRDSRTSVMWFERAATQGHAPSQFELARLYAKGIGAERDEARAAKLMEQAANRGLVWAMFSLGEMYRDGTGVAKDNVAAMKWFTLAAADKSPAAADFVKRAREAKSALQPALDAEQAKKAAEQAAAWRAEKPLTSKQLTYVFNQPVDLTAVLLHKPPQFGPEVNKTMQDFFPGR